MLINNSILLTIAAAEVNGNEMLKAYHRGAYGSKKPDEWSCCGYSGKNQRGCILVSDDSMVQRACKRSPTNEMSKMLSPANAKAKINYQRFDYTILCINCIPPI